MQYFEAVQVGRGRVRNAVEFLQEVAGPSSPVLFLKIETKEWEPVGDENLYSVIPGKESTAAVVLCDKDGNAKAISSWFSLTKADLCAAALKDRGLSMFEGEIRLPI